MPTYEYICKACTHEFEVFHSIKADPISICPKCKKKKLRRLIGAGGAIVFKGTGFYQTDYRSESYKKGAAADASSKPSEGKSSGEKSGGEKSGGEKSGGGSGGKD